MPHKASFYEKYIKRAFDILLSGCALIVLCPVMAITALFVLLKLGRPVIFSQERPGKHGRIFRLYKFRTMRDIYDESGALLPDAERLTPFGRALRSTSLDELPELWNIFTGSMSIVGPRPLLVRYLPRYSERQNRRHDVMPGLTGYAQANGRNALTWEEKFEMDVWYTEHISFRLDAKIVLQTVRAVVCRSGISSATSATMEEFMGTPEEIK
jgi:hypothetical protein